jgi:hypothetical protein
MKLLQKGCFQCARAGALRTFSRLSAALFRIADTAARLVIAGSRPAAANDAATLSCGWGI